MDKELSKNEEKESNSMSHYHKNTFCTEKAVNSIPTMSSSRTCLQLLDFTEFVTGKYITNNEGLTLHNFQKFLDDFPYIFTSFVELFKEPC